MNRFWYNQKVVEGSDDRRKAHDLPINIVKEYHDMNAYQIDEDRKEEEENLQQTVNELLSKELLQLSLKNRTAIQEEIHGVKCLAPEETPELLVVSLFELALALENDNVIPPHKKQAYRMSQQCLKTYVNDDSFRLRFLRFTLFDARKAADKIVKFLDVALELFGEFETSMNF